MTAEPAGRRGPRRRGKQWAAHRGGTGGVEQPVSEAPHEPPTRWEQRVPGPQLPGLITGATLLLGIWLAVTPFLWSYGDTTGVDARWNDVPVGIALAVLGLVRLTRPIRLITATALGTLLGLWLIIAPFLLNYGYGADSTRATINDVIVGVIIAGLSVHSYLGARDTVSGGR